MGKEYVLIDSSTFPYKTILLDKKYWDITDLYHYPYKSWHMFDGYPLGKLIPDICGYIRYLMWIDEKKTDYYHSYISFFKHDDYPLNKTEYIKELIKHVQYLNKFDSSKIFRMIPIHDDFNSSE